MPQGEIEKNISLFIKQQFPAIYREDGPELVQLVEDYYKWSETQTNQHIYHQRRYFETKDIDTTLESMIIFFKKKFMADLPLIPWNFKNHNLFPYYIQEKIFTILLIELRTRNIEHHFYIPIEI